MAVQFGLDTFGDITRDESGELISGPQTIRNIVDQAILADDLGIDFFGVGEHHRREFAVSAPEMVLAAIAGRTEHIRLGTGVTVLSSDDPVRVYERFATLDALSNGRADVVVGRGSFTESFPLFGFELADYNILFEEKLDLLTKLLREERVTWNGRTRAPLHDVEMFPKTAAPMPTWVGVGGSPESVVRTAKHGHGLMLAIIGGPAYRFRPFVDLFHKSANDYGFGKLPVSVHSPGFIAETDEQAWDEVYDGVAELNNTIGRERGWPTYTRMRFQQEVGPEGSQYVGSPERVAQKIAATIQTLDLDRFDLKFSNGTTSHELLMRSIHLYGTVVIPRVRELLNE